MFSNGLIADFDSAFQIGTQPLFGKIRQVPAASTIVSPLQHANILCSRSAKPLLVRLNSNSTKIQTICVPAGLHRYVGFGKSGSVKTASSTERGKFLVTKLKIFT